MTPIILFFYDIEWETDEEDMYMPPKAYITIEPEPNESRDSVASRGIDMLSDKHGWLIKSAKFEIR